MKPKSCVLDPIPSWLVKECSMELAPFLCKLVNQSLAIAQVPVAFKEAVIKPLLKKTNLDNNDLKNFRPVSNLPS